MSGYDGIAVVTGSRGSLGRAIVARLRRDNLLVVGVDLQAQTDDEASAADVFITADVTSEHDWERVVEVLGQQAGRVNVLVNNAGISGAGLDHDDIDAWDRLMAINSRSVFLGTRAVAPLMVASGGGSIINVSSIMGLVGGDFSHPGYHASKAAVLNHSRASAARLGPNGVRVNAVHPGYFPAMLGSTSKRRGERVAMTPLRRTGAPEELASVISFLAGEDSSFVTGASLVVDGGFLAAR